MNPDQMVVLDNRVNLVLTEGKDHLDLRVLWVNKVQLAGKELKASKEDRVREERKEAKEKLEKMEKRDHQVILAGVGEMERLDRVVWMAQPVTLVHLDYQVHVVKQAHKANLE